VVKVLVADLSKLNEVDLALDEVLKDGGLYGAILNAGVTWFGPNDELSWDDFETMLQVNVTAVVRMTNRLTEHFETPGKEGGILIVSSMAAVIPIPYQAAYSGTKAFTLNFATALSHELKNPDFSITVYTPGGIVSEMTAGEKFNDLQGWLMPVEQAAKKGLFAFQTRKPTYIPGFLNRLGSTFTRLLPKSLLLKQMSKVYRKSLANAKGR
jgi:uncharacterized protein